LLPLAGTFKQFIGLPVYEEYYRRLAGMIRIMPWLNVTEDAGMWVQLKGLFSPETDAPGCAIIREKLGRHLGRPNKDETDVAALLHKDLTESRVHAIPDRQMIQYWQNRSNPSLISHVNAQDAHVTILLNASETLMQPGSAEVFELCRQHPSDELNARRIRTTQNLPPFKIFRKPTQLVRVA
jgi:hypothetical protein